MEETSSMAQLTSTQDYNPSNVSREYVQEQEQELWEFCLNKIEMLSVRCTWPDCEEQLADYPTWEKHLTEDHRIFAYPCFIDGCGQGFFREKDRDTHITSHQHPHTCTCRRCNRSFDHAGILYQHNYLHHELGVFECVFYGFKKCEFYATTRNMVVEHAREVHGLLLDPENVVSFAQIGSNVPVNSALPSYSATKTLALNSTDEVKPGQVHYVESIQNYVNINSNCIKPGMTIKDRSTSKVYNVRLAKQSNNAMMPVMVVTRPVSNGIPTTPGPRKRGRPPGPGKKIQLDLRQSTNATNTIPTSTPLPTIAAPVNSVVVKKAISKYDESFSSSPSSSSSSEESSCELSTSFSNADITPPKEVKPKKRQLLTIPRKPKNDDPDSVDKPKYRGSRADDGGDDYFGESDDELGDYAFQDDEENDPDYDEYGKEKQNKRRKRRKRSSKFRCIDDECNETFDEEELFLAHLNEVHRIHVYSCFFNGCGLQFGTSAELVSHCEVAHPGFDHLSCGHCSLSFIERDDLTHHIFNAHWRHLQGVFECRQEGCSYVASTRHQLFLHYRSHHLLHPHNNSTAESTNDDHQLELHETSSQRPLKPFECGWKECHYATAHKWSIELHIRSQHLKLPATASKQNGQSIQQEGSINVSGFYRVRGDFLSEQDVAVSEVQMI